MRERNKFGFAPLEDIAPTEKRERTVGPMGAAVREAAQSLLDTNENKIEQRRRNAEDAKAWRAATSEGRVLATLGLKEIETTDLPRDRIDLEAVAASDEMDELKSSIRTRGQKEPIEVYLDQAGRYQLKKGWRRLTAMQQLFAETGDASFSTLVARIEPLEAGQGVASRVTRYIDMVEENVIREDLTFAEMAQVAIAAAADPMVEGDDAEALVGQLYGSLHKMKRSYIRSFVFLLTELEGALQWPKEVSRNVGAEVARLLKAHPEKSGGLRRALEAAATPEEQAGAIAVFVSANQEQAPREAARPQRREKYEFRVGLMKITARNGECRIVSHLDFTDVPRDRLERAVRRFEAELADEPEPHVRRV